MVVMVLGSSPLARGLLGRLMGQLQDAADHPRSRGVYAVLPAGVQTGNGSSPLARGLRGGSAPPQGAGGIIPARAGFTIMMAACTRALGDHPRSRGVYPSATGWRRTRIIIPARAGFTRASNETVSCLSHHPRSRGVYADKDKANGSYYSSSPLARGLRAASLRAGDSTVIIPARAGFTLVDFFALPVDRIIPARAGFTRRYGCPGHPWRHHPRSRGVYTAGNYYPTEGCASSPLARGLRAAPRRPSVGSGIIPARAGFTASNLWGTVQAAHHPRSRGVYSQDQ